ncbi:MAG TPA: M12 family metallopeptidase [Candidatus Angelobacter sp.]|nr:M12 family metallopeptidase [Candidatus Angelobacter sp.]
MTLITCTPKSLPVEKLIAAAQTAVDINPLNHAPVHQLARLVPGFVPSPAHIAVVTTKYWGNKGVKLTVGFMDNPATNLRKRILQHMNAWNKTANVTFVETKGDAQVRIAREGGDNGGYWSYIGTDILHIPKNQQTMNLEAFSMDTPESEYHRVVRHETGHTLGFPHEHMRQALVAKLDVQKTIAYFEQTQGWSEAEVRAQVLTPIEESTLMGTKADPKSIMCYQIPGQITIDGKPIIGGTDIDASDAKFAGTIYPKSKSAPKKSSAPKARAKAKPKVMKHAAGR